MVASGCYSISQDQFQKINRGLFVLDMGIDIVGHFSTTVQLNQWKHWLLNWFSSVATLSDVFIFLFDADWFKTCFRISELGRLHYSPGAKPSSLRPSRRVSQRNLLGYFFPCHGCARALSVLLSEIFITFVEKPHSSIYFPNTSIFSYN